MGKRFDPAIAKELLAPHVARLRGTSYADLRLKVLRSEQNAFEVTGPDGTLYQFEFLFYWDDEPEGDIRVIASVFHDPMGQSVGEDFILSPSGQFVGE
jgi:hypothetical protein